MPDPAIDSLNIPVASDVTLGYCLFVLLLGVCFEGEPVHLCNLICQVRLHLQVK